MKIDQHKKSSPIGGKYSTKKAIGKEGREKRYEIQDTRYKLPHL
jgi:hypothetical protein